MPSDFAEVLADLVGEIPGAQAAVFVDWEGEAVDQFGHLPEFDIKLLGAHWGVILNLIRTKIPRDVLGAPQVVLLVCRDAVVLLGVVEQDYYLVLTTRPDSNLGLALKKMAAAAEAIRALM